MGPDEDTARQITSVDIRDVFGGDGLDYQSTQGTEAKGDGCRANYDERFVTGNPVP